MRGERPAEAHGKLCEGADSLEPHFFHDPALVGRCHDFVARDFPCEPWNCDACAVDTDAEGFDAFSIERFHEPDKLPVSSVLVCAIYVVDEDEQLRPTLQMQRWFADDVGFRDLSVCLHCERLFFATQLLIGILI